jgi:hypothetical protein
LKRLRYFAFIAFFVSFVAGGNETLGLRAAHGYNANQVGSHPFGHVAKGLLGGAPVLFLGDGRWRRGVGDRWRNGDCGEKGDEYEARDDAAKATGMRRGAIGCRFNPSSYCS